MCHITTKDLEYYIILVDKAAGGYERINSSFERSSSVGKMLSKRIVCYREFIAERKRCLILRDKASAGMISQQPSTSRQDPPPAKRLQ